MKINSNNGPQNHHQKLTVKTNVKAGGIRINHNQKLRVKTEVKAGGIRINHNQAWR